MKFDNEADYGEWIATTYGIIKAFEDRGYALYELGPGPVIFTDIQMIGEFVQFGRTEDVLQVGVRYMVLPLVELHSDPMQVMQAVAEMVRQVRAPYFFNCKQESDLSVVVLGKHLIDSISVEPPFLDLSVDVRFGPVMEENTIELPLADAAIVIRKQVMMALRGNKASKVEKHSPGIGGPGLSRKVEV
ncbi:MAG: hypothetical protein KAV87_64380 [Desulfobacteraceae bacterium]|nr:hypothetical protein [Desulfobacteraceae bacterium]